MPSTANIQGALHVDKYLTDFSVNYIQDKRNFVGQRASSTIPVQNASDSYVVYERGYFWRDEVQPRPLGGRPQQVGYKITSGNYNAVEYGLEHVIDDRQRANVDAPIKLDQNATTLLSQKQMIKQDRSWAQKFFATSKWTTEATGVASSPSTGQFIKFNDASSDPIGTIDAYKDEINRKTGFMPNTLVLGTDVRRTLRTHPDISDRIKYTQTGIADEDILGKLFEVQNLAVARSVYNAAAEGSTDDFEFIVNPKAMWMGYIDPNPSIDSPTAIATFAWTGRFPGITNALGGTILRGRDDRAHSDYFQSLQAWDMRIIAQDLGVFFTAVVD